MKKRLELVAASIALAFGASGCAADDQAIAGAEPSIAAEAGAEDDIAPLERAEVVSVEHWNYDDVYHSWAAEPLIDEAAVVSSVTGDRIGDVENLLIGPDGRILSLIAEIGGFADMGDKHVSVPWEQVRIDQGVSLVRVPITEAYITDYSLFARERGAVTRADTAEVQPVPETVGTGPRVWKASQLIGDDVFAENRTGYGYVDDLIFDDSGEIEAVIIEWDIVNGPPYGPHAVPWYGYEYGFDPALDYYELPYGAEDVAALAPFDYERMGDEGIEE